MKQHIKKTANSKLRYFLQWVGWLCLVSFLCPSTAYAYLDPGTGSMLLSALIGVSATFFFMIRSVYYRAATMLYRIAGVKMPETKGRGIVFFSEGAQYCNTFYPVLEALDTMGHPAVYLTADASDPVLSMPFSCCSAQYIGTGNRAMAVMNMLEADVCAMTTPGLDVLQLRRSPGVKHYAHIVHAVTDVALYHLYSFDYFDSVLCSGQHQVKSLRYLEGVRNTQGKELYESGCPYLDVLTADLREYEKDRLGNTPVSENGVWSSQETANPVHLLVAPTWGRNGLLQRFGAELLIPLAEAGFRITVRPHPQSTLVEEDMLHNLQKITATYPNIAWDTEKNGFKAMNDSDVLISDLSGIVFDYAFGFERPVITVAFEPDLRGLEGNDLPWQPWELGVLPELGAQIQPEAIGDMASVIKALPDQKTFRESIRKVREVSVWNFGKAGEVIAEQLVAIAEATREQRKL